MVQVHVTPQITSQPAVTHHLDHRQAWPGCLGTLAGPGGFAKLPYTCGRRNLLPLARSDLVELEDSSL